MLVLVVLVASLIGKVGVLVGVGVVAGGEEEDVEEVDRSDGVVPRVVAATVVRQIGVNVTYHLKWEMSYHDVTNVVTDCHHVTQDINDYGQIYLETEMTTTWLNWSV